MIFLNVYNYIQNTSVPMMTENRGIIRKLDNTGDFQRRKTIAVICKMQKQNNNTLISNYRIICHY